MILVESKRMLSSSLEPIRSQISTMSSKIGENEESVGIVRRAIRQELGTLLGELCGKETDKIDILLNEIEIGPRMIHWRLPENRTEQSDSISYPGLLTRYQLHYIRVSIPWLPNSAFVTEQFRKQLHDKNNVVQKSVQHWWTYIALSRVLQMLRRHGNNKSDNNNLAKHILMRRQYSVRNTSGDESSEYSESVKSDIESLVDDLNAGWYTSSREHHRDDFTATTTGDLDKTARTDLSHTANSMTGRRVILDLCESSQGTITFTSLCHAFKRWGYLRCSRPFARDASALLDRFSHKESLDQESISIVIDWIESHMIFSQWSPPSGFVVRTHTHTHTLRTRNQRQYKYT